MDDIVGYARLPERVVEAGAAGSLIRLAGVRQRDHEHCVALLRGRVKGSPERGEDRLLGALPGWST
jgi:hypothetical protein